MTYQEALKILGLQTTRSLAELHKIYRRKLAENHPDKFIRYKDKTLAHHRFILIQETSVQSRDMSPDQGVDVVFPRTGLLFQYGQSPNRPNRMRRPIDRGGYFPTRSALTSSVAKEASMQYGGCSYFSPPNGAKHRQIADPGKLGS